MQPSDVQRAVRERLLGTLRGLLLPWGRRSADSALLDALPEIRHELDVLNESTEDEFLAIGEKLQQFHRRTVEIAGMSQAAARLMTGEDVDRVISSLNGVIEKMNRLERESRRNADTLLRVVDISAALTGRLAAFQKTVRSLRILCISIKIESARLGGDDMGFGDLGTDVGNLAMEIEERCARLAAHAVSLGGLLHQALAQVRDLESRQHAQAKLMVESIMAGLGSLTDKHARSSKVAGNLASRYQSLSRSIGQIVGSMQSHDITRQQIEHAKEAIEIVQSSRLGESALSVPGEGEEGVCGKVSDGSAFQRFVSWLRSWRQSASRRNGEALSLAGDVCELQMAQLRHARDSFVGAVTNIRDNLGAVSSLVTEMSLEAQQMVGAAGETDRLSLGDIGAGFTAIRQAHGGYAAAGKELVRAMSAVGRTLGDMSNHTGEIEGIGARIKLIALNAIVKAAHIGDSGVSLGVLAEGIHQLSIETGRQTESVTELIGSIISASEALSVDGDDAENGQDSIMAYLEEILETLPETLQAVNGELLELLTRMEAEGRSLSAEVLGTATEISVHKRVEAVIDNVVSQLGEIVDLAASRRGEEDEAARARRMQALQASYTMEEERGIHQSILASGLGAEAMLPVAPALSDDHALDEGEQAASAEDEADEDLGDNVELF